MNTRPIVRLLAVTLILVPGIRLLAQQQRSSTPENLSYRQFTLDLMEKNIREASEREELRANRKQAAPVSSLSATNFDLNKDGKLDEKEFAAWSAAVRTAVTKSPEAMKRFDADKDGKISDAEWAVAQEQLLGRAK